MMKIAIILILATASLAHGQSISVGKAFPNLSLPSVETGKVTEVNSLFGKKLMLHLFASW